MSVHRLERGSPEIRGLDHRPLRQRYPWLREATHRERMQASLLEKAPADLARGLCLGTAVLHPRHDAWTCERCDGNGRHDSRLAGRIVVRCRDVDGPCRYCL